MAKPNRQRRGQEAPNRQKPEAGQPPEQEEQGTQNSSDTSTDAESQQPVDGQSAGQAEEGDQNGPDSSEPAEGGTTPEGNTATEAGADGVENGDGGSEQGDPNQKDPVESEQPKADEPVAEQESEPSAPRPLSEDARRLIEHGKNQVMFTLEPFPTPDFNRWNHAVAELRNRGLLRGGPGRLQLIKERLP